MSVLYQQYRRLYKSKYIRAGKYKQYATFFLLFLFADGAVAFALEPESLQFIVSDTEIYCHIWKLKHNLSKTRNMIFECRGHAKYVFLYQ